MSFECIGWGVQQNTGDSTSKLILLMLCNYADENYSCYPSMEHIAKICHCSRRCVMTHINKLQKSGFIRKAKIRNGVKNHNKYFMNFKRENISPNTNISKQENNSLLKPKNILEKKRKNRNFLAG
jgi:pyocin large subunit-like protein